jgi:exopolyphosphatase/guanosine-5'-triphosphate,3'-diphosphate pyrophosphatase
MIPAPAATQPAARAVAAIDVGSSGIRMAVAAVPEPGRFEILDTIERSLELGKETFTRDSIRRATIEETVSVMKSFMQILREYGIDDPTRVRAVGTNAIREAGNAQALLDRVYVASGVQIEPIDETEVNRLLFLAVQPALAADPALGKAPTLVIEVGGGSTEWIFIENGRVAISHSFRLGSIRLRESLKSVEAPPRQLRRILESNIQRAIDQVSRRLPTEEEKLRMVILGGDARFAAERLIAEWSQKTVAKLPAAALAKLADEVFAEPVETLARKEKISLTSAETLGPALLSYTQIARLLKVKQIWIARASLRDGLLHEMAAEGAWAETYRAQIIESALEVGRKYSFDAPHSLHVAGLASTLFHALRDEHRLDLRYELLLHTAALLHDIGFFISPRSHHKHSMYLIQNSELFGIGKRDLLLIALIARYHRRAVPKPLHEGFALLDRRNRIIVAQLAAILRVADALDRSHNQQVAGITATRRGGALEIAVPGVEDITMETLALKQKGALFEDIFGLPVRLRKGAATEAAS